MRVNNINKVKNVEINGLFSRFEILILRKEERDRKARVCNMHNLINSTGQIFRSANQGIPCLL